jgi:Uncharacterised nucleotidyltransferase
MPPVCRDKEHIYALSLLTLNATRAIDALEHVASLDDAEKSNLLTLANSHHVVLRALQPLESVARKAGNIAIADWCATEIAKEKARISNAVKHLEKITTELEAAGCRTTVMKSLDHWPDLGNDLDLYSTADEQKISDVMLKKFNAQIEDRSWGDRLANKWNYAIPGLPEAVEVHAKRLGQTGEHTTLAHRFVDRRQTKTVDGRNFLVPAPEERIIVATLQRMYRHFYFRICDIANTRELIESGTVDFAELKRAADLGGIWRGVCAYLKIVNDYAREFSGKGISLPGSVLAGASFGGEKVFVRSRFIRVPIMPQGMELYYAQVTNAAFRGDVPAALRLSLLPPLASAAAISFKLTGSDKGIW